MLFGPESPQQTLNVFSFFCSSSDISGGPQDGKRGTNVGNNAPRTLEKSKRTSPPRIVIITCYGSGYRGGFSRRSLPSEAFCCREGTIIEERERRRENPKDCSARWAREQAGTGCKEGQDPRSSADVAARVKLPSDTTDLVAKVAI
jgi:hypothetical protein